MAPKVVESLAFASILSLHPLSALLIFQFFVLMAVHSLSRPKSTRITLLIQGYETHSFKSNFDSWHSGSAPSAPEEGRGKVAALLKQQGVGLKGAAKSDPVNEEVPPLLERDGKIEVRCINGSFL